MRNFAAQVRVRKFVSVYPVIEHKPRYGKVITASEIPSQRVKWLSPGRLAAGMISIMDGDPGLGKSTAALDFAARLSIGEPLPGDVTGTGLYVNKPVNSLIIAGEDSRSMVVRPRLEALGADLDRIRLMVMADEDDNEYAPMLDINLDDIRYQIEASAAKLLIVDPLMAHITSGVKSSSDQDVRSVLSPLARMAEDLEVAVLLLRHYRKSGEGGLIYKGGGSIGIIGASRFGLAVGRDRTDPTGRRRLLGVVKCNVGRERPTLAYVLKSWEHNEDIAQIEWLGETDNDINDILINETPQQRQEDNEYLEWVAAQLVDGDLTTKELRTRMDEAGLSFDRFRRIGKDRRVQYGIDTHKIGFGEGSKWVWRLTPRNEIAPEVPATPRKFMGLTLPSVDPFGNSEQ